MKICKIIGHKLIPTGGLINGKQININWYYCTRCGKVFNISHLRNK